MTSRTEKIRAEDGQRLHATSLHTLMVNVGLRCNMSCTHCHHACSPLRTEQMPADVIDAVIEVAARIRPGLVDITGGAPELHPELGRLITGLSDVGVPIQVRTNLTVLLEPEARGLIEVLTARRVRILASLPSTSAEEFATQRGPVFEPAIEALRALGAAGYGRDPRLQLDLAVNPTDDELPAPEDEVSAAFHREISEALGIPFRDVVRIANVPVGRFRDHLVRDGALDAYLDMLASEFNESTLPLLACRRGIEVAWDGTLSDCDFNLGRGMHLAPGLPATIFEFDPDLLASRPILVSDHCLACTARSGSG